MSRTRKLLSTFVLAITASLLSACNGSQSSCFEEADPPRETVAVIVGAPGIVGTATNDLEIQLGVGHLDCVDGRPVASISVFKTDGEGVDKTVQVGDMFRFLEYEIFVNIISVEGDGDGAVYLVLMNPAT